MLCRTLCLCSCFLSAKLFLCSRRLVALCAQCSGAVTQGDVKDTLKDAGSTIKDKVSGAADDAEGTAKSAGTHTAHLSCPLAL